MAVDDYINPLFIGADDEILVFNGAVKTGSK